MTHGEYRDVCARREHKDLSVRLRNLKTGEIGSLLVCSVWDSPEALMVRIGEGELTTWRPEEVQEVEASRAEGRPRKG